MLNVVAIMGRLVADPELRTTPQGTNVCSFRIACDRNFVRQGEQRQADFIDGFTVKLFNGQKYQVDNVHSYREAYESTQKDGVPLV